MKIRNKIISILCSLSMTTALLPAQFASAAEADIGNYINYATTLGNVPTTFKGHIIRLEPASDENKTKYDYSLTVSAYNVQATMFLNALKFNSDDVSIVASDGTAYSSLFTFSTKYVTQGKLTADMVSSDASVLVGSEIQGLLFDTLDTAYDQIITKESSGTYYDIFSTYGVSSSATDAYYTNTDTGAKLETVNGHKAYTTPTNKACDLYTLYFKVNSGKSVTSSTFGIYYDENNEFHGAAVKLFTGVTETSSAVYNEGVYFVGEELQPTAADQTVNFNVVNSSGDAIDGATITVYSDQAKTTQYGDTLTTLSGAASGTFKGALTYYYTVSMTGYDNATGNFTTGDGGTQDLANITLTALTEMNYDAVITVKDADTNAAVQGATVNVAGVKAEGTTDGNGNLTINKLAGNYEVYATMDGYTQSETASLEIGYGKPNSITVSMTPVRARLKLPDLTDTATGKTLTSADNGLTILVTKTSGGTTAAWADGGDTVTSNTSGDTIDVPKGCSYTITINATGYETQTIYAETDSAGTVSYYSDSAHNDPIDLTSGITVTKITEPQYVVVVDQDSTDKTKYTATVKLRSNMLSNFGTFGLAYDNEVFTLEGCTLNTRPDGDTSSNPYVKLFNTLGSYSDGPVEASGDNYYVFSWCSDGYESGGDAIPVTDEGTLIATYNFTRKPGKTEDDITSDAFSVMPFDKTAEGTALLNDSTYDISTTRDFLDDLWRYTDFDNTAAAANAELYPNNTNNLPDGRVIEDKALMGGFFQIYAVNGDVNTMYDSITTIQLNFPVKKGVLKFIVTDKDTNVALKDAEIQIYDASDNYLGTVITPESGIATYAVTGTGTYHYKVNRTGYWGIPKLADGTPGEVEVLKENTTVEKSVPLEKKIYHDPVLKYKDGTELYKNGAPIAGTTPQLKLTGDVKAYNGTDFYFNIEAAEAGKKIADSWRNAHKSNDTVPFSVSINGNDCKVEYDSASNMYKVAGTYVTGAELAAATATLYGFQSSDVIITLNEEITLDVDNTTHSITANAGVNGYVTYDGDAASGTLPATTMIPKKNSAGADITGEYSNITIDGIAPTATAAPGKFTFTSDSVSYKTEKVYINGVEATEYEGLTTFDYTFTDVTVDNDISVTFWDGVTPSTDTVITLVVGNHGQADVESPETATVRNTHKTFLVPETGADNLVFTLAPDNGDGTDTSATKYVVDKVRKSIDGGAMENITNADTTNLSYTVDKPSGTQKNVTVYVTFRDENETDSTDVFVTSYVKEGKGTISPVGIFPVNKHTSFPVTMTASSADWTASSVDVNGTEYKNTAGTQPYEYTVQSIDKDTTIGAVFTESTYTVKGYIDLSQNSNLSGTLNSCAFITCTRTGGGDAVTLDPFKTTMTSDADLRANVPFTLELPKGTWNITVSKQGYVNYTITDFIVDDTKLETDSGGVSYISFGKTDSGTKKITPYIGNTSGNGKAVSLLDAGVVANGLRTDASTAVKGKADVDDDGSISATSDMVFIRANYGQRAVKKSYTDFLAEDALTPLPTTAP